MKIYKVTDPEFKEYGRVIEGAKVTDILKALEEKTPLPEGVVYVKEGETAIFYFLPNTGYEIDAVYVDGNNIGKATSQNFPRVTKNHTIEVYFTIIKLSIFVSTNGYGYVSPDGNGSGEIVVDWGEETTFFFTPLM